MTKIAHLGCGYWGRNLVRNFAELGVLAAVVDANPEAAAQIGKAHGAPARTFEEVLDDSSIDAVSIATPAETHAALAIRAFERGKHVYVEKPLALTESECSAMIDAAEKAGRQLMVGHLLQYHPIYRKMRQCVADGLIGDLQYVYSNRMSLGKFRTEEDVLWSFAPHDVSMVLGLTGVAPSHVSSQGAAFATPGVADWSTTQLVFPNGVRGHIQVSWMHPFKEQRLVAIGSAGMLVFEDSAPDWDKKLALYPHSIDCSGPVPTPQKGEVEYLVVEKGEPLRAECAHFIECVRDNKAPLTDGHEGREVLEVLVRAGNELKSYLTE